MCRNIISTPDYTSHSSHASHATDSLNHTVFLAVDGISGFVWERVSAEQAQAAAATVTEALSCSTRVAGLLPGEVPVVLALADGTVETVATTVTGDVAVWVTDPQNASTTPAVQMALGSGALVAAVVSRFVALMGLPSGMDSEASA